MLVRHLLVVVIITAKEKIGKKILLWKTGSSWHWPNSDDT
jgi:hypothetical protein